MGADGDEPGLDVAQPRPGRLFAGRAVLIEDAPEFVAMITELLRTEGLEVTSASTAEQGLQTVRSVEPDLIVLDLALPDNDGVEILRNLRQFSDAYVVILTGRSDEIDLLVGLAVGADDYMTKPFSSRELVARIRRLLRRPRNGELPSTITFGELVIDLSSRRVSREAHVIDLTRTEFDLLATMASRPDVAYSRTTLRREVWGPGWHGDDHVVDVHIANLRKKLTDPKGSGLITTVRGVGYRLTPG